MNEYAVISIKLSGREATLLISAINKAIDELYDDISNPLEEDWWKEIAKKEIEKYEGIRRIINDSKYRRN